MSDAEYRKELRKQHKEAGLCCFCDEQVQSGKSTCQTHTERQRQKAAQRKALRLSDGQCTYCTRPLLPNKKYCAICQQKFRDRYARDTGKYREQARLNYQSRYTALKADIYSAYGNACQCCGERQEAFFELDHVNDNGAQHREELNTKGAERMYAWIKENNYPNTIQLLCANCHLAKTRLGYCPHKISS